FPSETNVEAVSPWLMAKRTQRKLARNDLCPWGSRRRFLEVLHASWPLRRGDAKSLPQVNSPGHGRAVPFSRSAGVAEGQAETVAVIPRAAKRVYLALANCCKMRCKFCYRPSPNYPSGSRAATIENK